MGVISINYKGGAFIEDDKDGNQIREKIIYESVEISYNNLKDKKIFNSGNFVQDWYDCNRFIIMELCDKEYRFSNSSSVDHFIMDGAPYESAYLKKVKSNLLNEGGPDNNWYLDYEYDHSNQGIEFFVPQGTKPTWEELKAKCKKD